MPQIASSIEVRYAKQTHLNYLLFVPPRYGMDAERRWPLILFLHGSGERGNDPELLKAYGMPKVVDAWPECPFIVLSPQCEADSWWTFKLDALNALLDSIIEQYRVDTDRIYLTGLSMGGEGVWNLAMAYPQRFAAIAPICGRSHPSGACLIKDTPVWVFHGAKDDRVPLSESERMVEALRACGANVQFTVYPEAGHDSWTETYNNPVLYEWFLQHKLG
jgi:predicted peptidase